VPLLNAANAFSSSGNTSFAGNVGIGTTSPSALFSVGSGSPFTVTSTGVIAAPSANFGGWSISSPYAPNAIDFYNAATTASYIALSDNSNTINAIQFNKLNTTTVQTAFINGNVGIGTTSPSALLSVGSTSQFQVNSSGVMSAAYGSTAANSGGTQEAICLADGTGGGACGQTMPVYNTSGTLQTAAHTVIGTGNFDIADPQTITLTSSAVFSSSSSYVCTANTTNSSGTIVPISVVINSGSSVTFTGTASVSQYNFICTGN
jgi:hypothetical protein